MSNVAVFDPRVEITEQSPTPVTLLGPDLRSSAAQAGAEATLNALTRGLAPQVSVVEDAATAIVVAPRFGKGRNESARLAQLAAGAKLRGQVVAFVGASVGELDTRASRALTRSAVKHADLTVMRDEQSAQALLDAGVEPPLRVGADPAWSELGDLFAAPEVRDQVVIALDAETSGREVDRLTGVLEPVAASGLEVVLQPWGGRTDRSFAVADRIADRVGSSVTVAEPPSSLREARDVYSTSRAVLAFPFHALMAAAASGSRTVAMGSGATGHLASTLGVPVFGTEAEAAVVSGSLQSAIDGDSEGNSVVPQLVDRARATIDIVRFLVTRGEDCEPFANDPLPLYPKPWRS